MHSAMGRRKGSLAGQQDNTAGLEELDSIGITEFLDQDPRPSLVLDLETRFDKGEGRWQPQCLFANKALRRSPDLPNFLRDDSSTPISAEEEAFWEWANRSTKDTTLYFGFLWTCYTLRNRWRVISSTERKTNSSKDSENEGLEPTATTMALEGHMPTSDRLHMNGLHISEQAPNTSANWIDALPKGPHIDFFSAMNWHDTPLGPLHSWSGLLRQMTRLLMADSRAASVIWGPEKIILYNEPYAAVASKKHPHLMGSAMMEAWAEIADDIRPVFMDAESTGRATTVESAPSFLERHGYLEETYFSYSFIPVLDDNGVTKGFYNTCYEITQQRLWQRRTSTLLNTVTAPDMGSYWQQMLAGFEGNDLDIPLAAIYSLAKTPIQNSQDFSISFQGALGIGSDHPFAFGHPSLEQDKNPLLPVFKRAINAVSPVVLDGRELRQLDNVLDNVTWRGFNEPSKVFVVLRLTTGEETAGFVLMGLNPRRAYDEQYEDFLNLLTRQLSTSLSTVALVEQARLKHEELSKDLAEGESRFKALTELNTAGLFYFSPEGSLLYANDTWHEMTRFPKGNHTELAFMNIIAEEDRAMIQENWHALSVLKEKRTFEVRLTNKWYHQESDVWKSIWVLACCGHESNETGSVKSIMGCITDISLQKQAQEDAVERATLSEKLARSQQEANEIQIQSAIDAEEARKGMEKFMDITSHEMRNPLSAILQSADGIASSLLEFQASKKTAIMSEEIVTSNLESVQIITLCAQHQGRIINDVLTLSKLDSAMLQVTPTPAQPAAVVKGMLKMFEGELISHGIELKFAFEQSYNDFSIDWVMIDPSRVRQILINLMTNAIKFTQSEPNRAIRVSIGGSNTKPPNGEKVDLRWFPSRGVGLKRDLTADADWGDGEPVYVYFAVKDSGQGLSEEEQSRLFHRFAQANPRTHVKYGGSGLGLFISRELTELHGGEIGLNSEKGVGSTFAFYVKARRASVPAVHALETNDKRIPKTSSLLPGHATFKPSERPSTPDLPVKPTKPNGDSSVFDVLLVEDNLINQKVLSNQLRKAGCVVHVANHGQEALEALEKSCLWNGNSEGYPLDIVLMDLEMPVMDGLTCSRRIRELQSVGVLLTHVPLIAVTANARKEQIEISIAAGMDDVMPKPFRVNELLPKMEKLKAKC